MNGKKVVGLGPKLLSMLERIIKHFNDGGLEFSYCQAGEYLEEKIQRKGGLILPDTI